MTTNQEGRQAALRDSTSSAYGVAADWHALFDDAGISAGTFNERLLAWINSELSASYSNLVSAMQAYAEDAGYDGWEDMATLVLAMNGAETLLDGETQGLAFDFTDQSALIIDTGTPANNYDSTGIVSSGSLVGPSGKLTYTSPSNKLVRQSDGYYTYSAHNLILGSTLAGAVAGTPGTAPTQWTNPSAGGTTDSVTADGNGNNIVSLSATSNRQYLSQNITVIVGAEYDLSVTCIMDGVARVDKCLNIATATTTGVWYFNGVAVAGSDTPSGAGVLQYVFTVTSGTTAAVRFGIGTYASDTGTFIASKVHVRRTPSVTDYCATSSAAVYSLPYEYDTSGNCLGLLVEEARTNLVTDSSQFDNAAWTKSNCTISANATTAPDGTASADAFIPNSGSFSSDQYQSATTVVSSAYYWSIYLKNGGLSGADWVELTTAGGATTRTWFNLVTGVKGTGSGTIEDIGNGWYRCSVPKTAAATSTLCYISPRGSDGSVAAITGDGVTPAFYEWCAQMELGSFPTSPIITYGAASSRLADNISIATSAFPYSETAGSLYAYVIGPPAASNDVIGNICSLMPASGLDDYLRLHVNSSDDLQCRTRSAAGSTFDTTVASTIAGGSLNKVATTFQTASSYVAEGGTVGGQQTSTVMPTNITKFVVGSWTGTSNHFNSAIKQLVYFPRTKTTSELQAETA